MRKITFSTGTGRGLRVLCLGAHGDDIEIGCGGSILRILEERAGVQVRWIVFSAGGRRRREAEASAKSFLAGAKHEVAIKEFKDGFFPYQGARLKACFETLKSGPSPDVVFTHCRDDLHQDHRLVSELTWNTFRDHLILEYEVIKYDGDLGRPNVFIQLSERTCAEKIRLITSSFRSQSRKDWFTPDALWAILRLRGIESRAPEKYAEGFFARKLTI
jgi:LmbE family N-acetylglucosaminyl deacetylase